VFCLDIEGKKKFTVQVFQNTGEKRLEAVCLLMYYMIAISLHYFYRDGLMQIMHIRQSPSRMGLKEKLECYMTHFRYSHQGKLTDSGTF